jgi:hypothetical protein
MIRRYVGFRKLPLFRCAASRLRNGLRGNARYSPTAGLKGNPTGLLAHLDQSHFPVWGLLRNYRVLGYGDAAWPMRSSRPIGADGMGEVYKGRTTRGWTGS